ncbi:DNA-binding protein, partial [Streptomyces microflavus]
MRRSVRSAREVAGRERDTLDPRYAREAEDTLSLVGDLAHRVALAVDNARLHAEARHTAERLQRSLLPDLPTDGPLDVVARYRPASASARV